MQQTQGRESNQRQPDNGRTGQQQDLGEHGRYLNSRRITLLSIILHSGGGYYVSNENRYRPTRKLRKLGEFCGRLGKVHNCHIVPAALKMLGDEPAMAVFGSVFAAK